MNLLIYILFCPAGGLGEARQGLCVWFTAVPSWLMSFCSQIEPLFLHSSVSKYVLSSCCAHSFNRYLQKACVPGARPWGSSGKQRPTRPLP